ncbi:hypothetical protein chiPu_0024369, partial [Chiloscyllium punctatum]|nr:hypothetical protein [Chiloscyllium punctatum]
DREVVFCMKFSCVQPIQIPVSLYVQDLTMKCNEEEKSLSSETFSKVSVTNLRRQAVPDLSSDLGMNIFKKVKKSCTDIYWGK